MEFIFNIQVQCTLNPFSIYIKMFVVNLFHTTLMHNLIFSKDNFNKIAVVLKLVKANNTILQLHYYILFSSRRRTKYYLCCVTFFFYNIHINPEVTYRFFVTHIKRWRFTIGVYVFF